MRESCTYGSVRGGAGSNRRPYRDHSETHQRPFNVARPLLEFAAVNPSCAESIDYSSATNPDAFTTGPQRSKSALTVAAN